MNPDILWVVVSGCIFLFLCGAGITSLRERERRAAGVFFALAAACALLFSAATVFPLLKFFPLLLLLSLLFLLLPIRARGSNPRPQPHTRIDERDVMFSRRLLEPDTQRYTDYYTMHPENREADDRLRALPGLLAPGSAYYHPLLFSAADASFTTVELLRERVDGPLASEPVSSDPRSITDFIRHWAGKLGALAVGFTRLQDYHLYSHVGRGPDFGRPVTLTHKYAIAFTVEMTREMLDSAPKGPTVMESARQYLNSGTLAVQMAEFIRRLGYPARAHIDGNYRVVCPLVALDAGLGEIGRMGLLMTPRHGPRVRISVVTTDLPLLTDTPQPDDSVLDFCAHCKKCAEACPAQAIPTGDPQPVNGIPRWQIDSEACYTLWCKAGTDCGRCMSVCPYSHEHNWLHGLVRRGIRNNLLFSRLAVQADHLFYRRIPHPKPFPDWMKGVNQYAG